MIVALLLFGVPLRELMVPEEVVSVSEIAQTATDFYLFDNVHRALFRVGRDGRLIQSFGSKGQGPGEWTRAIGFRIVDDEIWVFDLIGRDIHIYDHDFSFRRSLETPYLVRDALPAGKHIWVVGFDSVTKKMAHLLESDRRVVKSLFTGLEAEKLLGFQAGRLLLTNRELVFVHTFIPTVNIYRPADGHGETIPLEGLPERLVTPEMLSGGGDIRFFLRDLFFWNGTPVLRLDQPGEKKSHVYPIDLEKATVRNRIEIPYQSFPDRHGNLYSARYNGDDELQKLTLIEKENP